MSSQGRNYHIEQIENEDKKERMIDGVKSANKTQDKAIFGKPKVGKTLAKIYATLVFGVMIIIAALLIFDVFPNPEVDEHYILSFVTNGGSEIDSYEYDENKIISLPLTPIKEGYLFAGWYLDAELTNKVTRAFLNSLDDHGDLTFYARWVASDLQISLTFDTQGGSLLAPQSLLVASDLSLIVPTKANMFFAGWFLESDFQTLITKVPFDDATLYAFWSPIELITVGQSEQSYVFPTGKTDYNEHTLIGGYQIATTETTYQFWYDVRIWAEDHGYTFTNVGQEGSEGIIGALPSVNHLEPVTNINYVDAAVWLNALSEMYQLDPVYRDIDHQIVKDSNISISESYLVIFTNLNGFRLPSMDEWEMAARWTDDTIEYINTKRVGERYWTKGNAFSGDDENSIGGLVHHAWYVFNSQDMTHPVATKNANDLGLYDINGNVSEWCNYTSAYNSNFINPIRGGSFNSPSTDVYIYYNDFISHDITSEDIGFRIARGRVI